MNKIVLHKTDDEHHFFIRRLQRLKRDLQEERRMLYEKQSALNGRLKRANEVRQVITTLAVTFMGVVVGFAFSTDANATVILSTGIPGIVCLAIDSGIKQFTSHLGWDASATRTDKKISQMDTLLTILEQIRKPSKEAHRLLDYIESQYITITHRGPRTFHTRAETHESALSVTF